jgi:hypothetical protein
VFSAHLDTVFPEGTDVKVTRSRDLMKGPGIGDDCRGLALMLGVIRALDEGQVVTPGTITFVADVGEEGLGDLRGMKELLFEPEIMARVEPSLDLASAVLELKNLVPEKAKAYSEQYGVAWFTNYHEMLHKIPDVDVVAIITPSGMHSEHAMDVLRRYKKHLIVEKPTFMHPAQLHEAYDFAEKNGLRVAAAEALELLQSEAGNGKDMMKLMSDLIAYLRDLLVSKVKPDAVADDFNPELRSALETQAALIETDRLLELIDQFAGAEGRMKWAPNKRLHFEVAVIKAIQTLGQVTLNEVIENLSALRDGKPPTTPAPVRTSHASGHRPPLQSATGGGRNFRTSFSWGGTGRISPHRPVYR